MVFPRQRFGRDGHDVRARQKTQRRQQFYRSPVLLLSSVLPSVTSNDVFHKTLAPFLLRSNQSFISGDDLKADLAKIDAHWSKIRADLKATGSINYAAYPPLNPDLLTYQLWNRHMRPGWQRDAEQPIKMTPETQARIMENLRPMIDAFEKSRRGEN